MVDEFANLAVEFGNNNVSNLLIVVNQKLANQELGVSALGELRIGALQLLGNLFSLFSGRVFDRSLHCPDCVVLQDKILDPARDDAVKLIDELLSFVFGHLGLDSQPFPNLLRAVNLVSQGLGCLSFLC
jgi:hypothetical protein